MTSPNDEERRRAWLESRLEASQEWRDSQTRGRLEIFRRTRPLNLRDTGELHPDVAAWGNRLLSNQAGNLVLVGPTGSGKTWSAFEVLERAIAAGYPGRVVFVSGAEWRTTIAPPNVDRERLRFFWKADVLVLDDVASGRVNEWEAECMLGVIDERWANALPTVITSNAISLRPVLGERIASRLADRATKVLLGSEDLRRTR